MVIRLYVYTMQYEIISESGSSRCLLTCNNMGEHISLEW